MHMQSVGHDREGSRTPEALVKEFFARLRGLWAPKYIPQKPRHGDTNRKEKVLKFDLEDQSYSE